MDSKIAPAATSSRHRAAFVRRPTSSAVSVALSAALVFFAASFTPMGSTAQPEASLDGVPTAVQEWILAERDAIVVRARPDRFMPIVGAALDASGSAEALASFFEPDADSDEALRALASRLGDDESGAYAALDTARPLYLALTPRAVDPTWLARAEAGLETSLPAEARPCCRHARLLLPASDVATMIDALQSLAEERNDLVVFAEGLDGGWVRVEVIHRFAGEEAAAAVAMERASTLPAPLRCADARDRDFATTDAGVALRLAPATARRLLVVDSMLHARRAVVSAPPESRVELMLGAAQYLQQYVRLVPPGSETYATHYVALDTTPDGAIEVVADAWLAPELREAFSVASIERTLPADASGAPLSFRVGLDWDALIEQLHGGVIPRDEATNAETEDRPSDDPIVALGRLAGLQSPAIATMEALRGTGPSGGLLLLVSRPFVELADWFAAPETRRVPLPNAFAVSVWPPEEPGSEAKLALAARFGATEARSLDSTEQTLREVFGSGAMGGFPGTFDLRRTTDAGQEELVLRVAAGAGLEALFPTDAESITAGPLAIDLQVGPIVTAGDVPVRGLSRRMDALGGHLRLATSRGSDARRARVVWSATTPAVSTGGPREGSACELTSPQLICSTVAAAGRALDDAARGRSGVAQTTTGVDAERVEAALSAFVDAVEACDRLDGEERAALVRYARYSTVRLLRGGGAMRAVGVSEQLEAQICDDFDEIECPTPDDGDGDDASGEDESTERLEEAARTSVLNMLAAQPDGAAGASLQDTLGNVSVDEILVEGVGGARGGIVSSSAALSEDADENAEQTRDVDVSVSNVQVASGDLEAESAQRILRRHARAFRFCAERAAAPIWNATSVELGIRPDGRVSFADIGEEIPPGAEQTTCIERRLLRMRFPSSEGDGVTITFDLAFEIAPTGDEE